MEKLLLIDGNNLLFRSFYALPQLKNFQGEISNAVFGFTNVLLKVIKKYQPEYIAVAFDKGKKTFRHKEYADYKAQRHPTPKELLDQIPIMKNLLKAMHIAVLESDELEADDLIGCLSRSYHTENYILTSDKDLLQLITDHTFVISPQKNANEEKLIDIKELKDSYGISPCQIVDLKALMGDPSDNIPGVRKIGEKTALGLLEKYISLDGVYDHIDEIKGKLQENLKLDKEMAYLSYHLATIVTDRNLDIPLDHLKYDWPFDEEVRNIFERYQFNALLSKKELFQSEGGKEHPSMIECEKVMSLDRLKEIVQHLLQYSMISIDIETDIRLFAYKDNKEYVISLDQDIFSAHWVLADIIHFLNPIFSNPTITLVARDIKELKTKLRKYNIELKCQYFDLLLARYLINCNSKPNVSLSMLCLENGLGEQASAEKMIFIKNHYEEEMKKLELDHLYRDMELPLIDVLFEMEQSGFKLDKQKLIDTNNILSDKISNIENSIYGCVGKKFNINSPKQLGEILFDFLHLSSWNNKKRSTSVDVLNEIKDQHPVIPLILEYRQLSKLYSTYVHAFLDLLDNQDRVHSVFNQTMTATGRLSSSEPNLQNIPIRSEEGKSIRKLFISRFENGCIVSADYSQIELRLMAHFSKEPHLIEAYQQGLDIHASTASKIFNIPLDQVTDTIRRQAKAINFGIIYGISDFGLSQNVGMTRAEAKEFIKKYFEEFPKVKEYMDSCVQFCKEHGYIKTLYGRIRFIPEINNSNYMLRQFGERAAMNMPLQGTSSDLIKLAMIKVYQTFQKKNMQAKLIVQVHDELVIDCPQQELEKVKLILKDCMENIVTLLVPLVVDIHSGSTWYEAK